MYTVLLRWELFTTSNITREFQVLFLRESHEKGATTFIECRATLVHIIYMGKNQEEDLIAVSAKNNK